MATPTKQNPIPKVIALLLISLGVACLMMRFDVSALAKMDSMSAADFIAQQRALHHHSIVHHFLILLIFSGFFIGAIEFLSYLIGFAFKTPEA
jgi:hypothetical protein